MAESSLNLSRANSASPKCHNTASSKSLARKSWNMSVCPAVLDSYMAMVTGFFVYTPMEVLVLVIEMIAFAKLLREHSKRRAAGVAFLANLLSWALGGLLLLILPI